MIQVFRDGDGNEICTGDFVRSRQGGRAVKVLDTTGIVTLDLNIPWVNADGSFTVKNTRLNADSMRSSQWIKCEKPQEVAS